jgi:glutathione S-transferase
VKLYYSRNIHPRIAVAVARHLRSPVEFVYAAPLEPSQHAAFLKLNPNLRLPILEELGRTLWETDAVACRLSQLAGLSFWRAGDELPDMIRWLSWAREKFVAACDKVHFERITKQRYGLGPIRTDLVAEGLAEFAEAATLLDAHLVEREWLVGDDVSCVDFRMACFLPYRELAGLSLSKYTQINTWYARLSENAAWRDPFLGLDAPDLPPVVLAKVEQSNAAHRKT